MVKRTYPEVSNISDRPTALTTRALWDRIHDLTELVASLQGQIETLNGSVDDLDTTTQDSLTNIDTRITNEVGDLGDTITNITNVLTEESCPPCCDPIVVMGDDPSFLFADGEVVYVDNCT